MVLAVFGCLVTLTALLTAGPVGYLAATVVTGLVSTVVLTAGACRWLRAAYGPPVADPMATPPGLVPFLVKTSVTGSVSVGSESGVSLLAGLLGGPALVTYLKVATSMARFFVSFVSPVAAQLYPRLAHAGAHGRRTAVMSDALRSSALTGAIGALAVLVAAPLTGLLLGLVYGAEYMLLSTAAVVLLAGAALRGTVIWGKVLPTALGFPGVRLAFVAAEGVCQVGMIVTVTQLWAGPARMTSGLCVGLPVPAGAEHGLLVSCAAGPRRNHAPRERADGAGPRNRLGEERQRRHRPGYSVMSVHAGDDFLPTVVDAERDGKGASELWTFPVQGLGSGTSRPRPPDREPPSLRRERRQWC